MNTVVTKIVPVVAQKEFKRTNADQVFCSHDFVKKIQNFVKSDRCTTTDFMAKREIMEDLKFEPSNHSVPGQNCKSATPPSNTPPCPFARANTHIN